MVATQEKWLRLSSGVTNIKEHQGPKPSHLLEIRDALAPVFQTHSFASYDHAGINGGCISDASALKGTPLPQGEMLMSQISFCDIFPNKSNLY
jgi:hypothetical protein